MTPLFAKHGIKVLTLGLLAGSIALAGSGLAFAQAKGTGGADPAVQQRLEKRVDHALKDTNASIDQKKQIADILATGFKDMRPLREQRQADRKAMQAALQASTLDTAKIETIRSDEMKVIDQSSKLFTKALTDAGNVLNPDQRQAFFKNWNNRGSHAKHG